MKKLRKSLLLPILGISVFLGSLTSSHAQVQLTVDPGASWLGFMNVFELPANGGAFVFGSGWGTADLVATFSGATLTLAPNTIGDPAEFWYQGGGGPGAPGNKTMEANMYVENTGSWNGQNVTFSGVVLDNSLVSPYTSIAFIKDFAPDYSSFNIITAPLNEGAFSINLDTIADPARHVQFGFTTVGPNVWVTDVAPLGSVQITAVPEPSIFALLAVGVTGLLIAQRKRKL
ncbi:MAG: PEP-CTERM sorting domain-containing protein [Verrucomicrobia bacterium]|nr:PEP-CTERM sorting domain-containing protein [Verrucomicrobiota bacterium]